MKTNFKYDETKALSICEEYSEDFDTLLKLIERLKIEINQVGIIPSPWNDDLKALLYMVTVGGLTFKFYGSHADAVANNEKWPNRDKRIRLRNNQVLYSVLCCIRSDYYTLYEDPEDIGLDPDSIKDMAKWNEIKEHARKLQKHLKLTDKELESLPS